MTERGRPRRSRFLVGLAAAALAAAVLLSLGCGGKDEKTHLSGSGELVSKEYDLSGFTALRLDSGMHANVVSNATFAIAVSVSGNLAEHLVVEVDGDTLHIGLDPAYLYSGQRLLATIAMPRLTGADVSGMSKVRILGFASKDPLVVKLSGGTRATFGGLSAGDVTVDASGNSGLAGELKAASLAGTISGASRIGVNGSATSATLVGEGASNFDLPGFVLQDADVKLSGGSQGTVNVTGTLNADVSGGSTLRYVGSPTLGQIGTSGGGKVTKTVE